MIRKILNNRVLRNFSYLTVGSIVSQLFGIFTIIKITNLFAPNDYGLYTFILSQGILLFTIADLGITNVIIRNIARDKLRTNDLVFNGALVRLIAVLILAFLYILYNSLLGSLNSLQLVFVCLFTLINCFGNLFEIVFLGHEKMLPISLIKLSFSLIWFSIVFTLSPKFINVTFLFSTFLVLNAIKAILSFIILKYKNLLNGKVQNFWISSKKTLNESWPYFILVLIMMPVNHLSNNFLEINSQIEEVGYFNLSQKLLMPIEIIFGFALSAIFPNLSNMWIKNKDRFYNIITIGFKYFVIVALILCSLFTLFAREIVVLLFSSSYLPAVKVCQLQVWFLFMMTINSLIGTVLGAINKEKLILRIGIVNALISTPMLYFGSRYGAIGLSYGYVISFALGGIYVWYKFRRLVNINFNNSIWILAIFLFIISYFTPHDIPIIYRIILASIIVGIATIYIHKGTTSLINNYR